MKFILLNGNSCAGKSTVVKNILKQRNHLFHLSYDTLKWSFSQYSPDKQADDVRTALFSLADTIFKMKYDVICDSVLFREWRDKLIDLAVKNDYEIIEVNLEADYETLSQRFDERVSGALANPNRKISNLSKEKFKELYDIYEKEKNPAATTIRTDKLTAEEVAGNIMKYF
jgi:predicted kinase